MKKRKSFSFRVLTFYIGFWALSFFVLLRIFTREYDNGTVDLVYTFLFHIPLFVLVALNLVLISQFINKGKYIIYTLCVISLLPLGLLIHRIVFDGLGEIFFPGYYFISILTAWDLLQYFAVYLTVTLLLYLSKNWFELKEKQALLEKSNKEIQLESLKAQLNPHFLFNSLNNIYSLIDPKDANGREYLIKLSDTLRYMLYNSGNKLVRLEDDITCIENYIELEKLRLEKDVSFEYVNSITDSNHKIAPLLLLPLVENTFKHVDKTNVDIKLSLALQGDELIFRSINSIEENKENFNSGGIGQENTRKRLALLYPGKHKFVCSAEEGKYITQLKISLKQ